MNRKSLRRGFTLVEILVVMLIIAILAAIVVPRILNRTGDAKVTATMNNISSIKTALSSFRLDMDRYPTQEEGLHALIEAPGDAKNWRGPYLDGNDPVDAWGNPFVYEYPGSKGDDSFNLYSYGQDGAPGGDGLNQDLGKDN